MNVTVTDNKMGTITYGYSPEHFASVVEFYSGLVQDGSIYTYTVKMQCVGLDIPPEMGPGNFLIYFWRIRRVALTFWDIGYSIQLYKE